MLTQDGVVLIDSGHNPIDSRKILDVVKKLTPMPVRFLIDTEPHPDHTTGHFIFSPPAVVVAAAGAGESMRGREREAPQRIQQLEATSPAMKAALEGYKFIPPHVEYQVAIAAILTSGAPMVTQISAAMMFTVVVLAAVEIPLVSYLVTPERTHAVMLHAHEWMRAHRRQLLPAIAAVTGVFLLTSGIGSV